jgi:hypothetical protein
MDGHRGRLQGPGPARSCGRRTKPTGCPTASRGVRRRLARAPAHAPSRPAALRSALGRQEAPPRVMICCPRLGSLVGTWAPVSPPRPPDRARIVPPPNTNVRRTLTRVVGHLTSPEPSADPKFALPRPARHAPRVPESSWQRSQRPFAGARAQVRGRKDFNVNIWYGVAAGRRLQKPAAPTAEAAPRAQAPDGHRGRLASRQRAPGPARLRGPRTQPTGCGVAGRGAADHASPRARRRGRPRGGRRPAAPPDPRSAGSPRRPSPRRAAPGPAAVLAPLRACPAQGLSSRGAGRGARGAGARRKGWA